MRKLHFTLQITSRAESQQGKWHLSEHVSLIALHSFFRFCLWLHARPRGACIITNRFLKEQQKCHKPRKVNNTTSMMNLFPQWYVSGLNGLSQFAFLQLHTRLKEDKRQHFSSRKESTTKRVYKMPEPSKGNTT